MFGNSRGFGLVFQFAVVTLCDDVQSGGSLVPKLPNPRQWVAGQLMTMRSQLKGEPLSMEVSDMSVERSMKSSLLRPIPI